MFKLEIELTASPSLLDAMLKLALAFQGQPATATLQSTEEVKPAKTKKVQEAVKTVAEEVKPVVTETAAPEVKTETEQATEAEAHTITVEELRTIVRDKAQAGKREQIKAILTEMDSTSVTTLKEEQYADFLTKVNKL